MANTDFMLIDGKVVEVRHLGEVFLHFRTPNRLYVLNEWRAKFYMLKLTVTILSMVMAFGAVVAHGSEDHSNHGNRTKTQNNHAERTSIKGEVMEISGAEIKIKEPGGTPTYVMYDEQTIFEKKNQKVTVKDLRKRDRIVVQVMTHGAKFHAVKVLIGKNSADKKL
jgi:hypothetical protein